MTPPRVLVADPPWRHDDQLPGPKRGASKHYKSTMSVEEICGFEIPRMHEDSHLFLWRVSSMVEEAYAVVRAWGFEPTSEIVWVKRTKTGKRHFGMGRTVRGEHESCIVARRGRPPIRSASVRSTFEGPVGAHSEKPDAFFRLIEELTFGPYHELFARRRRGYGWTCEGNELPAASGPAWQGKQKDPG